MLLHPDLLCEPLVQWPREDIFFNAIKKRSETREKATNQVKMPKNGANKGMKYSLKIFMGFSRAMETPKMTLVYGK